MPVDLTGVFLAIIFWFVGMNWAFKRIRAQQAQAPVVRTIFWTIVAALGLALAGFAITFVYDVLTVGPITEPHNTLGTLIFLGVALAVLVCILKISGRGPGG
jgi:hypothetical protein